jgi:hypothetical protein
MAKDDVCPFDNESCQFFQNTAAHARKGLHFKSVHQRRPVTKSRFREDPKPPKKLSLQEIVRIHRGSNG